MSSMFRSPWVARDRTGRIALDLPDGLVAALPRLGDEVESLLNSDSPAIQRLFPTAYPDDPERDAGYQAMVRGELIDRHRDGIALIAATIDDEYLTEEQLGAWLTTVNALRLVLGAVLDISDDGAEPDLDEDDPLLPAWQMYHVLSLLLDDIVSALSS